MWLVLANLGVAAWFAWVVPGPDLPAPYDGPTITLLREINDGAATLTGASGSTPAASDVLPADAAVDGEPPSDTGAAADASTDGAAAAVGDRAPTLATGPAGDRCIAIGPFTDPVQADTAQATLTDAGFDTTLNVTQEEIWDGYWVFIGRLATMDAARDALARLAEAGIADAYVIPNSDSGILVSLGVFSDISRAGVQADRAGRLGLEATITGRTRTAETRWLELTLSGEESVALDLLQEPGRIRRLEERSCESR